MTRLRRHAAALAALALLAVPATASAAGGVTVERVDTSAFPVVHVTVHVPSADTVPDFAVTENGQPAAHLSVPDAGAPAAVALAIDTSDSMHGTPLADAVRAAAGFVHAQQSNELLAVYGFGAKAYQAAPFASDPGAAAAALAGLHTDGRPGTSIYAAVALAARDAGSVHAARKVLILLTDGRSFRDSATIAAAESAARAAGLAIYPVSTGSGALPPLDELAHATGGTVSAASSPAALAGVYRALSARLGTSVTLTYRSLAAPGRPIAVGVTAAGLGSASATAKAPGHAQVAATPSAGRHVPTSAGARLAVAGLVALFVLVGALAVLFGRPDVILAKRIAPYVAAGHGRGEGRDDETEGERPSPLNQLFLATESVAGRMNFWRRTTERLEQADLPLRTAELLYIQLGAAVLVTAIVSLLLGVHGILALAGTAVGLAAPALYVRVKAKRRLDAFEQQLPETLITMAASLKAGHAFNQAIQTVVAEGADPTAKEFARVAAEVQLGMPSQIALEAMAKRMGSYNFGFVVMAVNIQRTVGGSLAEILDMVADTVRQRQQFSKKVKALTAQGRMSAYALVAMPFLMAGLIWLMDRSFIAPLFNTTAGHVMLAGALFSMLLGSLVIRKIVNFKV